MHASLHHQQHKVMKTNRAMSILVSLLVCCVATSTVTGQSSSYGKDFYLGFMKNFDGNSNELHLMITTTSQSAVSVTIETSHRTQQVSVTSVVPARVQLNHADEGPVLSSDFANRNKGIHVYTTGNKDISVLVMNFISGGSAGEYLAYPYLDLGQDSYDYYAVSTNSTGPESTLNSEILIVAQENDTEVKITPTQTVVLPSDAQSNSLNITVYAKTEYVLTLHQRQTLLFSSVEDLSQTKISSDKPLTVVSGHECGNVPYNVRYCEHLAVQIPPTVTWGKTFLLAPFAHRRSGQVYKPITDGASGDLLLSCSGQTRTIKSLYEFETNSNVFCFLNSSVPVFLTQWSKGGVPDRVGDPTVAPVVPIEQYFNRVSFDSLPLTTFLFYYNYISITVPAENYSANSVILDGSSVRCTWTAIRNSINKIVGYGCTTQVPYGNHVISRSRAVDKLSVMVYGTHLFYYQAYAYSAGMELKAINLHNDRVLHTLSPGSFPYYNLKVPSDILPGVRRLPRIQDAISDPIYIKPAMPLQFKLVGKAFVSENGVISFEKPWKYAQPERLPTNNVDIQKIDMIAPFWSDNDIRKSGTVRYVAIKEGSSSFGDKYLENINRQIWIRNYPDFIGEYAIIAQWDNVHPFPHGNTSGYNISVDELEKTNTYQAVVITDGTTTFVQYTYLCDEMQWTKSGNKFAVVGFNLHGRRTNNYLRSGYPTVDGIASCPDSHLTKRSSHVGHIGIGQQQIIEIGAPNHSGDSNDTIVNMPCDPNVIGCICKTLIKGDENMTTQETIDIINSRIPSCPPSLTDDGMMTDSRFFLVESNCYIWAFYEEYNDMSFTRQCCYQKNSIIKGKTSRSGSLVAYHPNVNPMGYNREKQLKIICCENLSEEQHCNMYFKRRPNDDGSNYGPLVGATVWGDPHYILFNRKITFDFYGRESYILMGVKQNDQLVFLIEAKHTPCPHSSVTCMKTIAFGIPNVSLAYQFGDNKFEVYQTLGVNKLVMSSANKTGDKLWTKHGFLCKMSSNKIKAVFKIGSDAVSLIATQFSYQDFKYINLDMFLPHTKEFKKLNLTTFGLMGSHDEDSTNDFKFRNGSDHNRQPSGFNDWLMNDEDINLFKNPTRKRRQAAQAPFVNADQLNYTAEHIALCGDDKACLFDFFMTGERDFAVTTIDSKKNFTKTVETLKNFPPLMSGDETIRLELGQETIYNFTVIDHDGDNYTVHYTAVGTFANTSLTDDGDGHYSFKFTVHGGQVDTTLAITAEDSKGAAATLTPILEVCGCINGGNCTLQGLLTIELTTVIMNCECPEAYSGQFCERDTDGCSEIQCFEGVQCTDVPAPGVGAYCGSCPTGYTGDGFKCIDVDECSESTVCDQICTNTDGSYSCSCRSGYQLQADQVHCQDIDECNGVNDCQQQCNNTAGSYLCSCLEGFTLESDGRNCMAQNPCREGGACSHTCGLVNGVAQCYCPVGYELRQPENTQCVDKDECNSSLSLSPCPQICTNTIGSFSCSCRPGYRYIEEQNICIDIDECEDAARDGIALCVDNSKCMNTKGSYNCTCFNGYSKTNGSCERLETVIIPAEILANGIRITINNYNKENFTKDNRTRFTNSASSIISLFTYLSNYRIDQAIPFPGASIPIQLRIVDSTIRNNNEGKLTFLMYVELGGGLIPGNTLAEVMEQVKKNQFLPRAGFDIA